MSTKVSTLVSSRYDTVSSVLIKDGQSCGSFSTSSGCTAVAALFGFLLHFRMYSVGRSSLHSARVISVATSFTAQRAQLHALQLQLGHLWSSRKTSLISLLTKFTETGCLHSSTRVLERERVRARMHAAGGADFEMVRVMGVVLPWACRPRRIWTGWRTARSVVRVPRSRRRWRRCALPCANYVIRGVDVVGLGLLARHHHGGRRFRVARRLREPLDATVDLAEQHLARWGVLIAGECIDRRGPSRYLLDVDQGIYSSVVKV